MTASARDRGSSIDDTAAAAVQAALATEHAAIWCYSLAVVFLDERLRGAARTDAAAHLELRGQISRTLSQIGTQPVSAQPAYATPAPVTDAASAARLLVVAETDTLAAWRSVLERTDDRPLRQAGLDALSAATLRCARWRRVVGDAPAVPVLPGLPDPAP